ncbi:phage tail spike protein [Bacillus cereus]|uniref:phage tail spike protein n=1 Tax=Bacillus cereus TaxID=1396 RepID=UPI00032002D1|nr:phage tail spike protein [Bacillus cereus]MDZ4584522.1 tail fiber domain-containing protein [Bacillus cereus]MDZ4595191.1 tail fiber domain-containing protein [Bacillus cereus]MEB8676851.1 phage tail spike protein [Bacillus cereus]
MSAPSGDLHVVDFKTNQIVSAVQTKDYWDDKRHWEIKNNIDTLEFRVFENTDHAATLVQQNLVLKEVRGGRIVPYVITETEKDSKDRSLMVYASGEWIQLAKAGIIEPQKIESKTLKQCMEIALKGTKWKIGKTEHDGAHSMVIEEFTDPLDLLKKIAASFELEIQYRAEVVGSKIVGRYVDMVQKRGRDTRKEVTFGKDLIGIKRIENSQNICTALLGFVKKENGEFITISSINKGVPYLVDDAAYQRWNENGKHKFAFYTPQTDDQNMSPERLLTLMKTEMSKLVNASVSYGVDAQNIARIPGLSHEEINEGDTIRIIDEGFTPKLYLEARAIAGDESFKDPTQDNYVFGDYREIVDQNDELRRLYQKILSSLYDKVPQELFDQLNNKVKEQNKDIIDAKDKADQAQKESQTAKDLAETTQKYIEQNMVDIIEQPTAPTENLRDGKTLWIDSSDPENKVQKLWKDGQWQRVTPDTGPLKQSIKDVKEDIETAKTELNQKVQEAQGQATGQFNEVKESLQGVSRTISDVQNEQGNINKKVTQIEQNANGFKTSIESLTKKDTEISNKLNTVEQTVEGTKKTISDVQQTTSDLKKTTTEIKEEAGKISEKLTSVETKVNNTKIGGRNVVLGTSIPASLIGNNTANQTLSIYNFAGGDSSSIIDKEICVSFDWKVEGTTTPSGTMYMQGSNPWPLIASKITFSPQNLSGKYLGVITISGSAFKAVNMRLDNFTTGAKITVYNFQIEIGNKATDWTPAPEDQVTTDEFTKKTTEIEKSVEGVTSTVSTVQKNQGTMQSTLNKVEQTTNSNSQSITSLSQTQGQQGAIIQQNTSDITQLNNQMKSKVSDTQMQEYVGGLGSTNLLFNAAFEDRVINASTGAVTNTTPSTTKWSIVGTGSGITIVPESARHHEGYNSVKITATGQTSSKWSGIMQRVPAVQNGGDYVFSAWVYVQDKNTLDNGGAIKLQFFNGANVVSTFVQTEFKDLLVNNSWVLVSVKITSPNVAVTHLQGDIWVRQNGTIWVSQPQLQQGSTRSTFMENPKDYANYDQLVGEIAKKVATSDFNNKVTQMETTINQQSNRIDLKAEATNVYTKTEADCTFGSKAIVESHSSQLSVMSNEISTRIKAGEIASAINQTAQAVLIQARKIYLDGYIEAKHLRAQELVGITIKTAPQGSNNNHIRLNAQDMTLYGSGANRAYLGFMETPDGSIQPSLVLGSDNIKYRGTGSFYIYQVMPRINGVDQPSKAYAKFGVSKGENAEGTNIWSNYIQMQNDGGHLSVYSDGQFRFQNLNDIIFESEGWAPGYGYFSVTTTEPHIFNNNKGQFTFKRKGSDYKIHFINGATDHDLIMGNALIRSSFVQGYNNGLQIKDMMGQGWKDIELRTLRAQENVNANGQMWAKAFNPTSARNMKENIKDIPFSALDKIMNLAIKQYNFKDDMYDLYQMRVNKPEEKTEPYTTKEIETYFGMIADDTDAIFTDKEKRAINLYNTVSIFIAAFQQQYHQFNEELTTVKSENKQLKEQVATLTNDVSTLKELVQKLINVKPEQP